MKKPYYCSYTTYDRFGIKVRGRATFKTWEEARKFAQRVYRDENSTNRSRLVSWGTNKYKN